MNRLAPFLARNGIRLVAGMRTGICVRAVNRSGYWVRTRSWAGVSNTNQWPFAIVLVAGFFLAWTPKQDNFFQPQDQDTLVVETAWYAARGPAKVVPIPPLRRIDDAAWHVATEDLNYREKSPPPPKDGQENDSAPIKLPPVFLLYGMLGVFLLLVLGAIVRHLLRRRKGVLPAPESHQSSDDDDLPAELDLQALRANAIAGGDWSAAFRWSFLLLLADLSARDWIHWVRAGTNRHYAEELKALGDQELVVDFRHLGVAFERLRYGQGTMDQPRFEALEKRRAAFHERTKNMAANNKQPAS